MTTPAQDPAAVGPFAIQGRLGRGAMGAVYLARSPGGRLVAVKVVRDELADDAGFRARFAREIDAARRVSGAFTAAVVDADPAAARPWLATEYLPGPTLQKAIEDSGPLPPDAVRSLASGLAEALAAIHASGLVHRDLKPSNIVLSGNGPRVIDFGIARALEEASLTATGMVIGTPGYLSPEQITGAGVGPASDVFALGAVLVFAASGRGPFATGSPASLLHRIVNEQPHIPPLPAPLHDVVRRCLTRTPAERPTPADVLRTLGPASPPTTPPPPTLPLTAVLPPPTKLLPPTGAAPSPPARTPSVPQSFAPTPPASEPFAPMPPAPESPAPAPSARRPSASVPSAPAPASESPASEPFAPMPSAPMPSAPAPSAPTPFAPMPSAPTPFAPAPIGPAPIGPAPFGPASFAPTASASSAAQPAGATFATSRMRPGVFAALATIGWLVFIPADPQVKAIHPVLSTLSALISLTFLYVAVRHWILVLRPKVVLRLSPDGLSVTRRRRHATVPWSGITRLRVGGDMKRPWLDAWLELPYQRQLPVDRRHNGGLRIYPIAHGASQNSRRTQVNELRAALNWYAARIHDTSY
ncbi:protein kinase [Kribbella sp. NPDC003505]|uniref:protein kinase domain-containing protein n=1 Tax=Kribbella sp. NPDC003505 TaxID=3154448 RepID=UPI0033BC600D